jgi:Mg-chelatase subunit ChlD
VTARPVSAGPPPTDTAVLVIENLPAWVLGRREAERLAPAVTDGGLGLWVLGGDAAFTAGAYGDSPLEPLLPVSSRLAERPALHFVLVLDASGSMNETVDGTQKLTLAKRAVLMLRPALAEGDRIGVVAFAGQPSVVAPIGPLAEWDALRVRLLALEAGGGTRITPAVQTALDMFSPAAPQPGDDVVRHVLVLSDGRSEDFGVDRLVQTARARGATISAVATGEAARADLLGRLAADTGGRLYADADLPRLADTFLKEMVRVRGEGLREGPRVARWVGPEPVWQTAEPSLPRVPAWNPTRPKEEADLHWATVPAGAGETAVPLLATWRRGLGKVAATPWPAGTAPEAWLGAPAAEAYFGPMLAWLAGADGPRTWSARLVRDGAAWTVRVREDAAAIGSADSPFVAVAMPESGTPPEPVTLQQAAPGVHEAPIEGLGSGGGTVVVHRGEGGARQRLTVPALPPEELIHLGVDRARLAEIVRAGGGRVHDAPASFADVVHRRELAAYQAVDRPLVWAAAAVLLAVAALRILGRA